MRMNLLLLRREVFAGACGLLALGACAQGPLTPPGAPAATMKTLGLLEPRTAISNASYTISQPGSYYLTTNLVATGHGITISSDNVNPPNDIRFLHPLRQCLPPVPGDSRRQTNGMAPADCSLRQTGAGVPGTHFLSLSGQRSVKI